MPVLSADGTLGFADFETLLDAYERLLESGQFEAQSATPFAAGILRLRIQFPDSRLPMTHTAALRPLGPGRVLVGMGRAPTVLKRMERAMDALRGHAAPAKPSQSATHAKPAAAPTRAVPAPAPAPTRATPAPEPEPLPDWQQSTSHRQASPVATIAPAAPATAAKTHKHRRGHIARPTAAQDLRALFDEAGAGDAAPAHLGALLRSLGIQRATGRLRLSGDRIKTFWMIEGHLGASEAVPPRPEEFIGQLVLKMGKLTSAAPVNLAVEQARQKGRRTGEILVENGVLEPAQLAVALRAQTELRLLEASEWKSAEYEFFFEPAADDALLSNMRARVALARHVTARATPQELHACFDAFQKQFGRLRPLPDVEEAALLGDNRAGQTLRHAFPGTHRLHDALSGCPLGRVPTTRLLVLLFAYGALELGSETLVLARGYDPQAALLHRVAQARPQDPFRRLGAHPAMNNDQIREAYSRLLHECGPGGPWHSVAPAVAAEMAGLVEDAFRALYESSSRQRCRHDALGPDRARFVAELLVAQAQALLSRGDGRRAHALADVAMELADLPEARAVLAASV